MGRFFGFPMLVIGIVFSAYAYSPSAFDGPRHFAMPAAMPAPVVESAALAPPQRVEPQEPVARFFAPRHPSFATLDPQRLYLALLAPMRGPRGASQATDAPEKVVLVDDAATRPWRAVVLASNRPNTPQPTSTAAARGAPEMLARDIQRELRRVGCYAGEIDGRWGPLSKHAMATFMERVNAWLPVEEPDVVLFTLLKAHATTTCGPNCPAGQALGGDGRCLPDVIVARNTRQSGSAAIETAAIPDEPSRVVALAEIPAPVAAVRPLPGRMSIGGPAAVSGPVSGTVSGAEGRPADRIMAETDRVGPIVDSDFAAPEESIVVEGEGEGVPAGARLSSSLDRDRSTSVAKERSGRPRVGSAPARSKGRSGRHRMSNYQAVKHLFIHPLGRM